MPVGFEGAFDAYPIGQKPKLRGYIEVAAGEPIKANELLEMGEEDGTRYVRSKIEELRLQCNELISGRSK